MSKRLRSSDPSASLGGRGPRLRGKFAARGVRSSPPAASVPPGLGPTPHRASRWLCRVGPGLQDCKAGPGLDTARLQRWRVVGAREGDVRSGWPVTSPPPPQPPEASFPLFFFWTNQTNCDKMLVISGKTIKSLRLQLRGNVLSGGKRPVMGRPAPLRGRYPITAARISLSSTLQTPPEHLNYRVKIRIITRLKPITLIRGRY